MDAIAILDIGKTHLKVALVARGRVIELRRGDSGEGPLPPYLHLPTEAQWGWIVTQLRELSRLARITDIVPAAHGASIAIIDDHGLVLPTLDYQQEITDFDRAYEALARDFAATLSPRLPCGHHTGRQLFWLQRKFPKEFARAMAIVGLAQPASAPPCWAMPLCRRKFRQQPHLLPRPLAHVVRGKAVADAGNGVL